MKAWYVIVNQNGMRLCKDDKWRGFANFGSFRECVKTYRQVWWAAHRVQHLTIRGNSCRVVTVPIGCSMDAIGKIVAES